MQITEYDDSHHAVQSSYPIAPSFLLISSSSSCDWANSPDNSEVSLCIFSSKGSPSSSSCSIPTYLPGVKM